MIKESKLDPGEALYRRVVPAGEYWMHVVREGETLVIDVRNFVEDTWFGEKGYFHTEAMRITERLWRDGENLMWQVTVDDPNVLTAPWTMAPRMIKRSTQPLEESPACRETDGALLRNDDHHDQR